MLILASASPRRRELMDLMGLSYICIPSDVDEDLPDGIGAAGAAAILSERKAAFILSSHPSDTVIGSDTVVELDGHILGKPQDKEEAFSMLRSLSGKTHRVHTGVAILSEGKRDVFTSTASVTFYDLEDEEILRYIKTGEPMDKAGAYGIQGLGSYLVKSIEGDFYTIMGFPISEIMHRLRDSYGMEYLKESK